jgi:hypothetical protein
MRKLPPPPPPQPQIKPDSEWGAFCWFVFRETCCAGSRSICKSLHADLQNKRITTLQDIVANETYRAWITDILFMELQLRRVLEIIDTPEKQETHFLKEFYKALVNQTVIT